MERRVITLAEYARLVGNTYLTTWSKAKAGQIPGAYKQDRNWWVVVEDEPLSLRELNTRVVELSERLSRLENGRARP